MQLLRGLEALPDADRDRGCVATVGVFDGVHLGHFVVMRRVVQRARALGVPPTVVTFVGHPKQVLVGRSPATVTSLQHRLLLFERIGLEKALVLDFTPELRDKTGEQFLREVLLDGLGLQALILGFDSKFGKDRGGTVDSLAGLAAELGFGLEEVAPLRLGGRAVSSTAVREAVQLGELERAAAMLGRPVSVLGTVVPGDGRGRTIGFATANLDLHHELRPPDGVYAAFALCQNDSELRPAVVNIGTRPTFDSAAPSVEVHLIGFEGDLYGVDLEVFFLSSLRSEQRFESAEELIAQIGMDVQAATRVIDAAPESWRIPGHYLPIEGASAESLVGS